MTFIPGHAADGLQTATSQPSNRKLLSVHNFTTLTIRHARPWTIGRPKLRQSCQCTTPDGRRMITVRYGDLSSRDLSTTVNWNQIFQLARNYLMSIDKQLTSLNLANIGRVRRFYFLTASATIFDMFIGTFCINSNNNKSCPVCCSSEKQSQSSHKQKQVCSNECKHWNASTIVAQLCETRVVTKTNHYSRAVYAGATPF